MLFREGQAQPGFFYGDAGDEPPLPEVDEVDALTAIAVVGDGEMRAIGAEGHVEREVGG